VSAKDKHEPSPEEELKRAIEELKRTSEEIGRKLDESIAGLQKALEGIAPKPKSSETQTK
jgi:hypothetical protein